MRAPPPARFASADLVPPTPDVRHVASTREERSGSVFELPPTGSRDSRAQTLPMPVAGGVTRVKKPAFEAMSPSGRRILQRTERSASINIPKLVLLATYKPANQPAQTRGVLIDPEVTIAIVVKSLLRQFELCTIYFHRYSIFSADFRVELFVVDSLSTFLLARHFRKCRRPLPAR
jgi:hypothetical protein